MRAGRLMLASMACGCLFFASAGPAGAAMVAPGATISFDGTDPFTSPSGEVVAEETRTLTLTYDPGTNTFDPAEDGIHDLSFHSQVIRDPVSQRLTFLYEMESVDGKALAGEAGTFTVGSFDNFTTDLSMRAGAWTVTRSADGETITGTNPGFGAGTLPNFFIATDATEFDANGSISGDFAAEFGIIDEEGGPSSAVLTTSFSLGGTFQPLVGDDDGGNGDGGGDGGNVIPLPAGVWLGLIALAGTGAATRFRRKLGLI